MAHNCPNLNNSWNNENRDNPAMVSQINTQISGGTARCAPLECESAQPSKNPSVAELMEVYAAKRRKDNISKPVEVEDPLDIENAEVEADESPKRKPVKKRRRDRLTYKLLLISNHIW
ncbi:hypothetical protein C2G38_2027793 [Gigaspora rosea]|uniref:Uncharacterized protein n=1 Tax=Gigaspora rosea TaxID=44941 RepID=A0A397W7P9_9GLOM|nr:hypothetical protein C2G38_2027793 [Gigaspora rosea]